MNTKKKKLLVTGFYFPKMGRGYGAKICVGFVGGINGIF